MKILILASLFVSFAAATPPECYTVDLRGQTQVIHFYGGGSGQKVLFAPGDGGWRGAAVSMAKTIASWGYDVYGFDTKRYLEGFTATDGALTDARMASDLVQVAWRIRGSDRRRVLFMGWSQGAAMAAMAAASKEGKAVFGGLALVGLPRTGVLGWRYFDTLATLAGREPREPSFECAPLLRAASPLPVWMAYGNSDEYTTPGEARALTEAARTSRKVVFLNGNHRFDGNRDAFFEALKDGLAWLRSQLS